MTLSAVESGAINVTTGTFTGRKMVTVNATVSIPIRSIIEQDITLNLIHQSAKRSLVDRYVLCWFALSRVSIERSADAFVD